MNRSLASSRSQIADCRLQRGLRLPFAICNLRFVIQTLAYVLAIHAGTALAQDPANPAPAPAPQDQSKPKPVVLDPATLAKLRKVAFEAAREGDTKTLDEYFQAGQPADIRNTRGDSLLILACYYGHDDAVKTLLAQHKTLINTRNKMGFTALTGAAYKGYIGIVKQLAAKKADLDVANERGQTPLMFAAMFGRTEVVRYLIDQKVNLQAKDDAGKTARDLAQSQGNTEMAKILLDAEKPPVE